MAHDRHASHFHSALRWLAAGRTAAQMVSWVMTVLVIRILSPTDYGLAAMVATVTALITIAAEFGFGVAIVQAREVSREQLASVFGAAMLFGALASLAVAGLAPLAASFYGEAQLEPLLQVASLNFLILSLGTVPDGELRRNNRFDRLALADFSSALVASTSTYILALAGSGVWALLTGQLIASGTRVLMLQMMAPNRVWPSWQPRNALRLIHFGGKVAIARIADYFVGQSDFLIAGRLFGKEQIGHYYVAIDLAMLPLSKVMSIVNQAALPSLARLNHESQEQQGALLMRSLRLMAYVMVPSLWGMAAISPWLIPVLLGEKWEPAVLPLQLVCLALPLRMLGNLVATALLGYGQADIELKNEITSALIFPLAFLCGAQFGIVGLAASWCVALPLSIAINLGRARPALGISFREVGRALWPPVALALLMALCVHGSGWLLGTLAHGGIGLFLLVGEGVLLFAGAMWLTDRPAVLALLRIVRPSMSRST